MNNIIKYLFILLLSLNKKNKQIKSVIITWKKQLMLNITEENNKHLFIFDVFLNSIVKEISFYTVILNKNNTNG